jgi:uncharacterized protein YbbK (DUF523 family)
LIHWFNIDAMVQYWSNEPTADDHINAQIIDHRSIDGMRPRVGISRCLLGDEVRYDGTHRLDEAVIASLGPHVEWVAVCPEVEIGMGTPREPIQLVRSADGVASLDTRVRLIAVAGGTDWTARMHDWAAARAQQLKALGLSGYVFKARSPSCGIGDVPIRGAEDGRRGRGLFAEALIAALPDLPVADEASLADAAVRARFLDRVLRHPVDRSPR